MGTKSGRLILPHVHIMARYEEGGARGRRVTGILFPYLLEQMVSAGALEVFITDAWRYGDDVIACIPEQARKYVRASNVAGRAQEISDSFFETVFRELGIIYKERSYCISNNDDIELFNVMQAHLQFQLFLEAFFLKAHVHFNVDDFIECLQKTLALLRLPENRIKIVSLISVLSVYKPIKIPSPNVIAVEPAEKARRLGELILTEEYRLLSMSHFGLGALTSPKHLISQIKLQLQNVLALAPAKDVINYASKAASVAVSAPIPDSQLVESFVREGFLPVAIDLTAEIRQAIANFKQLNPGTAEYLTGIDKYNLDLDN
jgi:hypothetical protein